jgi:hypothetical protein
MCQRGAPLRAAVLQCYYRLQMLLWQAQKDPRSWEGVGQSASVLTTLCQMGHEPARKLAVWRIVVQILRCWRGVTARR